MKKHFSTNLKFLRTKKKFTQSNLSSLLKKDYSTIGKWENNLREPTLEDIIAIAEIFEIPIGDLLCTDLREQEKKIDKNDFDNDIQKIAIDNKIEIRYKKNAPLTSETATKAIKAIMDVLENQNKN